MKYYKVEFKILPMNEDAADILAALMADCGFETFETTENGLTAYIQQDLWDETTVDSTLEFFPMPDTVVTYNKEEAPDENWNAQWETEGFAPVVLDNLVCIHSTEHTDTPQCAYDIVINPRMAFGTGSHPTTCMILRQLCSMDLSGMSIIDAGCGTGVLGILCAKRGASNILAYDIDEWSTENSKTNFELNGIKGEIRLGASEVIANETGHDLLIANINRNILLGDMARFAHALKHDGGQLLLSGFYEEDIAPLLSEAAKYGLKEQQRTTDQGWAMVRLKIED